MKLTEKAIPIGSSTTSKFGLGFGIAGTVLGAGAALSGGTGLFGGLFGAPRQAPVAMAYPGGNFVTIDANGTPCGYNNCCGGGYVTKENLNFVREINEKDAEISILKSEKYTNEYVGASLAPVYAKINEQEKEICNLKSALAMESERRVCGDEKLFEYINGNYIKAEKSLNSRAINYHGVKPTLELKQCCCTSTQTTTEEAA